MQAAFDALIRVWSGEHAVMLVSDVPQALDAMNLVANINAQAILEQLEATVKALREQVAHESYRTRIHVCGKSSAGAEVKEYD